MVDTGCTEGGGPQGVSGSTEGVLSMTTDTPTAPPVPMDTTPDDASVGGVSDKVKVPNSDKVPTGVSGGESSAEGESDKDSETKATPPLTTTEDTAAADSADKQDDDEEEEEEEEEEEVGEEGATRIENIMKTVEDQYGGDDYDSSGGGDEEWEDPADKAARLKEEEVLAAKKAALLRRASYVFDLLIVVCLPPLNPDKPLTLPLPHPGAVPARHLQTCRRFLVTWWLRKEMPAGRMAREVAVCSVMMVVRRLAKTCLEGMMMMTLSVLLPLLPRPLRPHPLLLARPRNLRERRTVVVGRRQLQKRGLGMPQACLVTLSRPSLHHPLER